MVLVVLFSSLMVLDGSGVSLPDIDKPHMRWITKALHPSAAPLDPLSLFQTCCAPPVKILLQPLTKIACKTLLNTQIFSSFIAFALNDAKTNQCCKIIKFVCPRLVSFLDRLIFFIYFVYFFAGVQGGGVKAYFEYRIFVLSHF